MHELAVATGIVEIVRKVCLEHGKHKVNSVHLVIGALTCVDTRALRFALEPAMKGTLMEGAEVMVEPQESVARCRGCGNEFSALGFVAECPLCHGVDTELVHGRELYVRSIEAE